MSVSQNKSVTSYNVAIDIHRYNISALKCTHVYLFSSDRM